MRLKPIPAPPDSFDAIAEFQRAVPLVPGSVDDCCTRLLDRCDLDSRDAAREWLTFLRALELVEKTPDGFRRRRIDPEPEALEQALLDRVFGARELETILAVATKPPTPAAAFFAFREHVPQWERHRDPNGWESTWRRRVERLLGWFVLLDVAEDTGNGYRLTHE